MRCGFITICPEVANTRVWPSGGDLTVSSTAIEPDAPGRCSMTTGCIQVSVSFCATMRAKKSVAPPGGCPERKRTGLDGYTWPGAGLPCVRRTDVASTPTIVPTDREAESRPIALSDEVFIEFRFSRIPASCHMRAIDRAGVRFPQP